MYNDRIYSITSNSVFLQAMISTLTSTVNLSLNKSIILNKGQNYIAGLKSKLLPQNYQPVEQYS